MFRNFFNFFNNSSNNNSNMYMSDVSDYIYDNSVLKESFVSYGFPFVGSHWIPHFTIASLITNRTHPIITDFMQWKPLYIMNWFNISFWHIDDEHHTRLDKQLLK